MSFQPFAPRFLAACRGLRMFAAAVVVARSLGPVSAAPTTTEHPIQLAGPPTPTGARHAAGVLPA
jgi:hypothetical protein